MAHRTLATLSTLLLTLACSSSKPPESSTPETEPAPAEPALASTANDEPPPPTSATAATAAAKLETLFVRDQRAACEGEGPRECLQVRNSESEEWRNLFASIEGFSYEPGNSYELRVEVTPIANPPADASSLKYALKEVVSKKKTAQ